MTATQSARLDTLLRRAERAAADIAVAVNEGLLDAQMPPDVEVGQKYYNDGHKVHLAVVIHRRDDARNGLWVSTDGDPDKIVRLPIRRSDGTPFIAILSDSNPSGFAVIRLPGWLANGRTGEFARPPLVNAKRPQLCDRIQWTARQRADWAGIQKWLAIVNAPPRVRRRLQGNCGRNYRGSAA